MEESALDTTTETSFTEAKEPDEQPAEQDQPVVQQEEAEMQQDEPVVQEEAEDDAQPVIAQEEQEQEEPKDEGSPVDTPSVSL